ncbi:MAG: hypothetical protein CPDRYMAC_1619 [uncultured Paraburkholderia sp.]|nr:MAG: hypothetical protein CPDRYMAC_1619 [uncultured Paraburkholderia sp.]
MRTIGFAMVAAATVLLAACGGGSGGSSASTTTSVLKLSSAVQSEHVARYAGAFGILSGPGVAAIYTSIVQSLVSGTVSFTMSYDAKTGVTTTSASAPTVTISNGNVQEGVIQLSTSDTVETITANDSSNVTISVTSAGKTGSYMESVDDFRSLAGG